MWKNKSVSDLYEPGSTFKVITSSIAIEENITFPDNEGEFVCTGYEHVADRNIACWRYYNPHGYQSLRKALENSCNPAFIQLSRKLEFLLHINIIEHLDCLKNWCCSCRRRK